MPDFKPFSIYDDDPEKAGQAPSKPDASPDLWLEIEEVARQQSTESRPEGQESSGSDRGGGPDPELVEKTPFLTGQAHDSLEDRTQELIRTRKAQGKLRDRRKVASIFDKPIEPDRPIVAGRARWHPLGHQAQAFWFLAPAFFLFSLFYLYPTLEGFAISMTHYSPLGSTEMVGWGNYQRAFHDQLFWQTVVNAAAFTLGSLLLGFFPPILLAIFLNEISVGKGWFKILYLLPFVIPAIPAANLWKWMYDDGFGLLNSLIHSIDPAWGPVGWLTDRRFALISIVLMFVWKNTGWYMLIYFSALQNLPEEIYEAAELDGAGILEKIKNVTLPHLRPVMWMLSIIQVITAFQIFTEVYAMTNGGPEHSTEVIGTYIYKTAFGAMDLGYASAMAMLMFAALFTFTAIRFLQIRSVSR